jgi:two-component system LytT family response regulator
VLIADDERPARDKLHAFLQSEPDIAAIYQAADGVQALEISRAEQPDIVFLDIRMPGLDGLGVAELLPREGGPLVVFVTAFDQHALRAFELNAADYLLKPFDRERFDETLIRVRRRLAERSASEDLGNVRRALHTVGQSRAPLQHLLVDDGTRKRLLSLQDVQRFEAAGNLIRVFTSSADYHVRGTLSDLELHLDPAHFVRVNRSEIISVAGVDQLTPAGHGDLDMRLKDGTAVRVSRRYADRLDAWRMS